VSDCALERQGGREPVGGDWECDRTGSVEVPEVVVTMTDLRRAAGVHAVDLGDDLIVGPQPREDTSATTSLR
jgi:hypothetical protein